MSSLAQAGAGAADLGLLLERHSKELEEHKLTDLAYSDRALRSGSERIRLVIPALSAAGKTCRLRTASGHPVIRLGIALC
jgi:hypothetical protein